MGRSSKSEGDALANLIRTSRIMGALEANSHYLFRKEQQKSKILAKHLEVIERYLTENGKGTPAWILAVEATWRLREFQKLYEVLPKWACLIDDGYDAYWDEARQAVRDYNKELHEQIEKKHTQIEKECNSMQFKSERDAFDDNLRMFT